MYWVTLESNTVGSTCSNITVTSLPQPGCLEFSVRIVHFVMDDAFRMTAEGEPLSRLCVAVYWSEWLGSIIRKALDNARANLFGYLVWAFTARQLIVSSTFLRLRVKLCRLTAVQTHSMLRPRQNEMRQSCRNCRAQFQVVPHNKTGLVALRFASLGQ
jgi:hypothetical protein